VHPIPTGRAEGDEPGFAGSRLAQTLLVVAAALLFAAVSLRPLSHSEFRYAEAGAEMAKGGDWVVPHLSYVPYFEKPILTYWLEAASQIAFGTGWIAVRAPSILACVAMVWTTYALGRHLRGAAFGLGAAALLASSALFQEMGTAILTDAPFSAFLVFAWYAFLRHERAPQSAWIWAFWTSLGLAFLTKGPLGLALVGSSVGAYLLLAGRLRDCLSMHLVRGGLVVVAINLPWTLLVWQRDPRFLEFFYVRQNFQALYDSSVNHAGPFHYYLPFVVGGLFPFALLGVWGICVGTWTGIAPAVRRMSGRADGAPVDEGRLYVACTVLVPLLFLSAAASKLGTYILPLLPAMAILAAAYVADHLAKPTFVLRYGTVALAAVLLFAACAVPPALEHVPVRYAGAVDVIRTRPVAIATAAGLLILPMLAGGIAMVRGRMIGGMCVVGAGGLACVLAVNSLAPSFGAEQEAAELVASMNDVRAAGDRVVVSGPCSDDYAIALTLGRRPFIWGKTAELGMGHFAEVTPPSVPIPADVYRIGDEQHPLPENPWLFDRRSLKREWRGVARMWLVCRVDDLEWLRGEGYDVNPFAEKYDTAIVTNHPLP
jgi:4-amino-4-deoxy-L-arabinose transferase-like glycosyltransferase